MGSYGTGVQWKKVFPVHTHTPSILHGALMRAGSVWANKELLVLHWGRRVIISSEAN
jgi:hypothetical protein